MSFVANALYYRPRIEAALSVLDKARLKLPIVSLAALFEEFDSQPVILKELPEGPWSSPVIDVVMIAKIALCLKPRRVLEVGSYRGYTARMLAAHTPPTTSIVTLDRDPRHGVAYRDSPLADKIERRVGRVSEEAFAADPAMSYDLIYLDADHTYEAVKHDTEILLPLLARGGMFVWHDYANWGRFSRKNGVPEALHELAMNLPIAAIAGTWLAAHAPAWTSEAGSVSFAKARQLSMTDEPGEEPWDTTKPRG